MATRPLQPQLEGGELGSSPGLRQVCTRVTDSRCFPLLRPPSRWNQLDLAIVLLSVMGITLEEIEINAALPINPTIIRIMRVLRIARGEGRRAASSGGSTQDAGRGLRGLGLQEEH